jgi:hypothetical protein
MAITLAPSGFDQVDDDVDAVVDGDGLAVKAIDGRYAILRACHEAVGGVDDVVHCLAPEMYEGDHGRQRGGRNEAAGSNQAEQLEKDLADVTHR